MLPACQAFVNKYGTTVRLFEMSTLKGLFPSQRLPSKNFLAENIRRVRQLSAKSQSTEVLTTKPTVGARSSSKARKSEPPPDGSEFPHIRKQLFVQCRNQASQTGDDDCENGSVRYPSNNVVASIEVVKESPKSRQKEKAVSESTDSTPKETAKESAEKQTVRGKTSRRVGKTRFPKREPVSPISDDPDCPLGHTPMPDKDRLDMLESLTTAHDAKILELNKLPVGTDTLRVRTRKIELERLLNQLEEGIKLFNKPKVYIKVEE